MNLAESVRRADRDRFLCALFAPAAKRETVLLLLAFNHELARAREAARTPLLALMRLQWWRDAVEDAAAGKPPRAHEVAAPLHAAIAAGVLPAATLLALVEAREAETEGFADQAALDGYLAGTAGGLAALIGAVLGAPEHADALRRAGALYGLAGVLRSVPAWAAAERCPLPESALTAVGLSAEAAIAAPLSAPVQGVIRRLAETGLAAFPAVREGLRSLPRGAIAAALPLQLAARDLPRLHRTGTAPARRGLADPLAVIVAGLRGRV